MTKLKKFKRAIIPGTFDLLHIGHTRLFHFAKLHAEEVIVSINTDEFVKRFKGKVYFNLKERIEMLEALKDVDRIVINIGDEDCKPILTALAPDVIIHGTDWRGQSLYRQMGITQQFLDKHNIKFLWHRFPHKYSSTHRKKFLNATKMAPKRSTGRN